MWRDFWNDVMTPGPGETPRDWAATQAGHALIGAAAASTIAALMPMSSAAIIILTIVLYAFAKEFSDLRRGGTPRDGLIDTAFVGVGAFYPGHWSWPVAILAILAIGITFYRRIR